MPAATDSRRQLVPVVEGVFGVRVYRHVDAFVCPKVGVRQVWSHPRLVRECGKEHQIRGALGDRPRRWNETDPTLAGDASVGTSLPGKKKQQTRALRSGVWVVYGRQDVKGWS